MDPSYREMKMILMSLLCGLIVPQVQGFHSHHSSSLRFRQVTYGKLRQDKILHNHESIGETPIDIKMLPITGRRQILNAGLTLGISAFIQPKATANARGLVQFPMDKEKPLMNTYHFMRAGESLLEEENILYTNPLFLTNRENALSDRGRLQIQTNVADILNEPQNIPSIVMFSLAAHCMDTADVLKNALNIGQSRLMPEYTFLDPRGAGKWDSLPLTSTEEAIWALDAEFADKHGLSQEDRPPPNDDGTPNETLGNAVTRLRQLMSGLESQYSGETILLIFPDGTGPALLACCMAGVHLNRVHEIDFPPGHLQLNVTPVTALELLGEQEVEIAAPGLPTRRQVYLEKLERGKKELQTLRTMKPHEIISVRDKKYAEEQNKAREDLQAKEAANMLNLQIEAEARKSRLAQIKASAQGNEPQPIQLVASAMILAAAGVLGATLSQHDDISRKEQDDKRLLGSDIIPEKQEVGPHFDSVLDEISTEDTIINETVPQIQAVLAERSHYDLDPEELADLAMAKYLEQDDGHQAWLSFLEEEVMEAIEAEQYHQQPVKSKKSDL